MYRRRRHTAPRARPAPIAFASFPIVWTVISPSLQEGDHPLHRLLVFDVGKMAVVLEWPSRRLHRTGYEKNSEPLESQCPSLESGLRVRLWKQHSLGWGTRRYSLAGELDYVFDAGKGASLCQNSKSSFSAAILEQPAIHQHFQPT